MGKSAPESPKSGKTTKFMISWKPVMSSIRDAIAIPNAVNEIPTRIMKASAIKNPTGFAILRPSSTASTMMMNPWITAVVAPPASLAEHDLKPCYRCDQRLF